MTMGGAMGTDPGVAKEIIAFGAADDGRKAARITYDVPLPGQQRGRRILKLDGLDVADTSWNDGAKGSGVDLVAEVGLWQSTGGAFVFDEIKAKSLFVRLARAQGIRGDRITSFEATHTPAAPPIPALRSPARTAGLTPVDPEVLGPWGLPELFEQFRDRLREGKLLIPQASPSGEAADGTEQTPDEERFEPALFLVEHFALSSFAGDYGLGRTVKTYTLLPGEQVTLRIRNWRSSEASVKESSSVFDSASEEARSRFHSQVVNETTDKASQSKSEEWHAEAKVSAGWGWGSASVSGGGSGQYHSGREQFAKQVNDASREHAAESSSKRDTTVTSSSEHTDKTENEESTERVIRNVNLRRALNFVFRELNQRYTTKVHLTEVTVGFTNGQPGSWRETPLSGLHGFLHSLLEPTTADAVAQHILGLVSIVFDHSDTPLPVLETFTMSDDGQSWTKGAATIDQQTKKFPAPSPHLSYRFNRAPLGQDDEADQVPGVVLKKDEIVLRTDSVVVEALLGQADALDVYAMASQEADAEAKLLANRQTRALIEALEGIADGKERLAALAALQPTSDAVRIRLDGQSG
ncbi:hypothetical protein ACFW3D_28340 [Streptomyces sp. NPDC058864]